MLFVKGVYNRNTLMQFLEIKPRPTSQCPCMFANIFSLGGITSANGKLL